MDWHETKDKWLFANDELRISGSSAADSVTSTGWSIKDVDEESKTSVAKNTDSPQSQVDSCSDQFDL